MTNAKITTSDEPVSGQRVRQAIPKANDFGQGNCRLCLSVMVSYNCCASTIWVHFCGTVRSMYYWPHKSCVICADICTTCSSFSHAAGDRFRSFDPERQERFIQRMAGVVGHPRATQEIRDKWVNYFNQMDNGLGDKLQKAMESMKAEDLKLPEENL